MTSLCPLLLPRNRRASSYAEKMAPLTTNARVTAVPRPRHSTGSPSSLTLFLKQSTMPRYLAGNVACACSRDLTTSSG
uniref:Uncharacterized protein n=1 Tax=Arundo donax TaxID=35708 RepID=A0A0A9F982_ARUDO